MIRSCLFVLFLYIAVAPQSPTLAQVTSNIKSDTLKRSPATDVALQAAKRWTQAALADSSNLLPIERDFLLIGLAAQWAGVDQARAEEYLAPSLDHLKTELKNDKSGHLATLITNVSGDVMKVDRAAWNSLMDDLPANYASLAISDQAQDLALDDNAAGAIELEEKALKLGGSERDYITVEDLIGTDRSAASKLFDEMLATAAKSDSNPMLLANIVRSAFDEHEDDEEVRSFYDEARMQSVLAACAQKVNSDNRSEGCFCAMVLHHVPPQLHGPNQEQLASMMNKCEIHSRPGDEESDTFKTTDDIVRAMNETPDANRKSQLRHLAAQHSAENDRDYARAIQLCLDLSDQERQYLPPWRTANFGQSAVTYAFQGIERAVQRDDRFEPWRLLNLLPGRLRAKAELNSIRLVKDKDKAQAVSMLDDARQSLDQETPADKDVYGSLVRETADLSPKNLNLAWRALVNGLNQFVQSQQTNTKNANNEKVQAQVFVKEPLHGWFVPQKAIFDEDFVRACAGDLTSPEDRANVRLGVVAAFLQQYSDLRKKQDARPTGSVSAASN